MAYLFESVPCPNCRRSNSLFWAHRNLAIGAYAPKRFAYVCYYCKEEQQYTRHKNIVQYQAPRKKLPPWVRAEADV